MTPLSNLTSRNLLIAIHDTLATTLAVFTGFYLRFEGDLLADRLPPAAAHSPLFRRTQRCRLLCLQSDHHKMALHFVARRIENSARGDGAGSRSPGAGSYFVATNAHDTFFFGKITIILYWFLEVFF